MPGSLPSGRGATPTRLAPGTLGVTPGQVANVVALTDDAARIEVRHTDGRTTRTDDTRLGAEPSAEIFGRTGSIGLVEAQLPAAPA